MFLTRNEIKNAVENFYDLLEKQEKLQNQLIKFSGRDPEQETAILMRLESIEKQIEFIDEAIFGEDESILNIKEQAIVMYRSEGRSVKEIAELFLLTPQQIRNILNRSYQKMADAFSKRSIA